MTHQIHLAAQYLAAAGMSFLDKKNDDSHTNLKFSIEDNNLHSRPLNDNGNNLSFNFFEFALQWNSRDAMDRIYLNGTSHIEIMEWIKKTFKKYGIEKPYIYESLFELPNLISEDFVFKLTNQLHLFKAIRYRRLVENVLEVFLKENKLVSEVGVCPYNLDTAAYSILDNETNLFIRLGLAVPDAFCNEYYLYLCGYTGQTAVDTSHFLKLAKGEWHSTEFKGAILPVKGVDIIVAYEFFESALAEYKKNRAF